MMNKIEEDVQFLLALKMVMKRDVKDKIKMKNIDDVGKNQVKRMIEAVDAGIKALDAIPKYEKALALIAADFIKTGICTNHHCPVDEPPIPCKDCKIAYYKQKAGLEVSE